MLQFMTNGFAAKFHKENPKFAKLLELCKMPITLLHKINSKCNKNLPGRFWICQKIIKWFQTCDTILQDDFRHYKLQNILFLGCHMIQSWTTIIILLQNFTKKIQTCNKNLSLKSKLVTKIYHWNPNMWQMFIVRIPWITRSVSDIIIKIYGKNPNMW